MSSSSAKAQNAIPNTRAGNKHATRQVVIHPVLFALFYVLFLYAPHQSIFGPDITFRPAIISLTSVCLIWLALRLALGDSKRAAVLASLAWLLLFSSDSLRQLIVRLASGGELRAIGLDHQILLGIFFIVSIVFVVCYVVRRSTDETTYLFNIVGTILVLMPLTQIGHSRLFGSQPVVSLPETPALRERDTLTTNVDGKPDIYYIVLDGYGRADQLRRIHDFDNEQFIEFLQDRGFRVLSGAVSNYPQTLLSITSSLNLDYLHEFFGPDFDGLTDRRFMRELLAANRVNETLRDIGYKTISIASPYYEANVVGAETVISDWLYPTLFECVLLERTPVPWVLSRAGIELAYATHRARILYSLDTLVEVVSQPGPKFVYSHILYAHPPFVFDRDGAPINPKRPYRWIDGEDYFRQQGASPHEYIDGYKRQVSFLNGRLQAVLAEILARSKRPPIIIVQGDHGPGVGLGNDLERTNVQDRYSILSALYLPPGESIDVSDSMSPVNTFRTIFNQYFGTSFPLLENRLYYATFGYPYDFTLVESALESRNLGPKMARPPE